MTRPLFRAAALALLAVPLGACLCRPPLDERVRDAERENQALRFRLDASEQAAKASRDYAAELASGGPTTPLFSMYYTPTDVQSMGRRTLPYTIPAKDFDKRLQGNIIVERIDKVEYLPGNRMKARIFLKGRGMRFTGQVPDFAKGQVKSFMEGIEAGVTAELDVTLTWSGSQVRALARATKTTLHRNSNASHEGQLRDQMNARALKNPLIFDVAILGTPARLQRMLITGNHLVLTYQP